MKVLITGSASRLGRAVAAELAPEHTLRLMDEDPVASIGEAEVVHGSLLEPEIAWRAVRGVDAVVHTGEPPATLAAGLSREQALLERAIRGTHVLLSAAVEAGVGRVVYGSTLAIFAAYPDDVYISERWEPQPRAAMGPLSRYLGELTCREMTRTHHIGITALRLGEVVVEEEVQDAEPNLLWLDVRDAARAFGCALRRDTGRAAAWPQRWEVYHIAADIPNAKYLIDHARGMGYEPRHNFAAHWSAAPGASA
jgi:nucleoside-diphosphate-sugar epimerase